jgi:hypothetical protein
MNVCRSDRPPPLSKEQIKELPLVSFMSATPHINPDCPVCLEKFTEYEQVSRLPSCTHVFHPTCIESWLLVTCTCPICRKRVIEEEAEEEGKGDAKKDEHDNHRMPGGPYPGTSSRPSYIG